MAQLYRKALLDRLSSPEQLDRMIVITSPSFWIAMVGAALAVTVALVWSIFGELPVKQEASGILVPDQGAYTLAAETGGIVSAVEVEIGDYVEEGDVVATLVDSDMQNELDALIDRYEKVEAVTLESLGDIVTQDNRDLVNLKSQISTAGVEGKQQSAMLSMYQADLAEIAPKVAAAEAAREEAKEDYYSYMRSTTDSDIELDFNEAQSAYSQYSSLYTQYSSSADNARATYRNTLDNVLDTLKDHVKSGIEILDNTPDTDSGPTPTVTIGSSSFTEEELRAALDALNATRSGTAPSGLSDEVVTFMGLVDGSGETYSQLDQLWLQYETAVDVANAAESDFESALDDYEDARDDYERYADRNARFNARKERLGNIYNELSSEYNNLYSQEMQLKQQIASIEGQLRAARIGSDIQVESYKQQFEATRSALLYNLQSEIDKYKYNMEKNRIKSTVSGTVSDVKVNAGSALGQGSDVVTIRQLSEENLIVCYIPLSAGKKVEEGMTVIVKPTTVNEQEYGHMEAEVVLVDDYVATATSMRGILGDDALVQAFTRNGPVVGVTCRLRTDESTASGYWWSNPKAAGLTLPEGTMVAADIITDRKTPISMLIPLLKEKLDMAVEPEADNGGGN